MTKIEYVIVLIICAIITMLYYLHDTRVDSYAISNDIISNTAILVKASEEETITMKPLKPVRESKTYYPLTDEERALVESVVMAESGGEDYDGQRLVAQCILNACILEEKRPDVIVVEYQYTKHRPEPSESVVRAVAAVFDNYDVVTEEPILVFYAPRWCTSEWHESQQFILEHGGHRFFAINS